MRYRLISSIAAAAAMFAIVSLSTTPAEARTICKGSACYKVMATKASVIKKKHAKSTKRSRYAYSAGTRVGLRTRRVAQQERVFPWHGWGASFHHEGIRYPGGNPSGPPMSYNIYEGGFHPDVFWKLSDRSRH